MGIEHPLETEVDITGSEMSAEELLQTVMRYDWTPHPERHGAAGSSVLLLAAIVILGGLFFLVNFLISAIGAVLGWW